MGLLPSRAEPATEPGEAQVLDIEGEEADRAFEALAAKTTREVLSVLYEEPRTPTEVRERVGTSLQNVHYHLEKLEGAGLIRPAGTGYSEKGTEMTVYAPTSEALVLFAGTRGDRSRLRDLLGRVLGLFAVLAVATLGFRYLVRQVLAPDADGPVSFTAQSDGAGGGDAGTASETIEPAVRAAESAAGIDPALAFFLGGAVVVVALGVWWYVRARATGR